MCCHFCGVKKGFLALPPGAEVFQTKQKAQVLIFFVVNTVLVLLFMLKGILIKACGKKCPLLSSSAPLENP